MSSKFNIYIDKNDVITIIASLEILNSSIQNPLFNDLTEVIKKLTFEETHDNTITQNVEWMRLKRNRVELIKNIISVKTTI